MSRHPDRKLRRRAKPRQNRKRRNFLPLVFGVFALGLLAEGAYAGLTSPRFALRAIDVEGNRKVASTEILQNAGIPLRSNIFLIRTGRKAVKVAQIPRIRSVQIRRRLPDRMVIRVEERRPALVLAAGPNRYLVDETGVPYSPVDETVKDLPVLQLDALPAVKIGQPLQTPEFLAGARVLPQVKSLIAGGGTLQVDPYLNLCLNRSDFSVRLGQPDHLDQKLKLLQGLLQNNPRLLQDARYVDVSAPEAPAFMPKGEGSDANEASSVTPAQTVSLSGPASPTTTH